MRVKYRIISLYDEPLHPRPSFASHHYVAPANHGGAILTVLLLPVVVAGVFWLYGGSASSERPAAPALTPPLVSRSYGADALRLVPPRAPAPDMNSPAVTLANADLPKKLRIASPKTEMSDEQPAVLPAPAKSADAPPKKKKAHVVRRLKPEAADSFASGFNNTFGAPFGGW